MVTREFTLTGNNANIPQGLATWLVVQAGRHYHPQKNLATNGPWAATAIVGRKGFGAKQPRLSYPFIILTSTKANEEFKKYLVQQPTTQPWAGMPLPPGTIILATTRVTRNDYNATLASITGVYDEYRDRPLSPTGGIIMVAGTTTDILNVTRPPKPALSAGAARSPSTKPAARSLGSTSTRPRLGKDELSITGQDKSGTKPYFMRWKKR
jgi:hypothetical protein